MTTAPAHKLRFAGPMLLNRRGLAAIVLAALLANTAHPSEPTPPNVEGYEIALTRQQSGAYTVSGQLGPANHTQLLVDTGSSYVVLSPATFKRLTQEQPLQSVRTIRGAMADGQIIAAPVYRVPTLGLGAECTLTNVEAVVLPGASTDILGLSALSRMGGVTMDFVPQRLKFSHCRQADVELATAKGPVLKET